MKECSKCKEVKDFSNFYKSKRKKSGFSSACKSCERKYVIENRENISNYKKEYRKNNKEKIEKWFHENKELLKQKKKIYRENPENKQRYREWLQNNEEKKKNIVKNIVNLSLVKNIEKVGICR